MDINKLQEASAAVDSGEWVCDIPSLPGVELKVLGFDTPEMVRKQSRALRLLASKLEEGEALTEEAKEVCLNGVMVEVGLIDWRGFTSNGKPAKCTTSAKAKLVQSSLFMAGLDFAISHVTNATRIKLEALAKNSLAPSKSKRAAAQP